MTARTSGDQTMGAVQASTFTVVMAEGLTQTDVGAIAEAIRLFRGVVSVTPFQEDADAETARNRIDAQWRDRIVGLLDDEGV